MDSPVADTAKAKITIKKGAINVNTDKVTFAEDKKTALVETAAKLTKGDYEITVSGVATKDITSKLTAEDEKVAKIDVTTKTAPYKSASDSDKDKIIAKYVVLNQYGEDITKDVTTSEIKWTSSTGSDKATATATGTLEIGNAGATGTAFIPGAKVYLTGVYAKNGVSAVVNAELTVGLESKADQVIFKGVYDTVAGKIVDLPAGFTSDTKYVLLFETKDQYDNVMPVDNVSASSLVFTSNNPLFVKVDSNATLSKVEYDGTEYSSLPLKHGDNAVDGGKVTISVISNSTGKTASYTIDTAAASQVKTFTMSAPQTMVAEGEKVEIPFTAVDQYGKAVTAYSALNNVVTLNKSIGTLEFEAQNDGSAKLFYTAPASAGATENADAIANITSLVTKGGSFSNVMINIKQKATAKAIIGLKDVNTNVAAGNSVPIATKNIVLQDQYGRTMTEKQTTEWFATSGNSVKVESTYKDSDDNSAFVVGDSEASATATIDKDSSITVKAEATRKDATEKFVFSLNNGTKIPGSEKTITFTKVKQSEYKSYEVDDLGTMYVKVGDNTAGSDYAKEVKVYGVKEDGTKVQLPSSEYTIDLGSFSTKFATDDSKISDKANGVVEDNFDEKTADGKASDTKTIDVNVAINDSNTGAVATTITKKLVLSKAEAKATTVLFDTDKVVDGKATIKPTSGAISADDLNALVTKVKDQYGVEKTATVSKMTISEVKTVEGSAFKVTSGTNGTENVAIAGAKLGDKFKVTYTADNGVTASIDITVGVEA